MSSSFDEFAEGYSRSQENRARLITDATSEWVVLKGFVSQFALDGREFTGHKFEWFPEPHSAFLALNHVAVVLSDRDLGTKAPPVFRVRFDRRPLGPGRLWADERSPLDAFQWSLSPAIKDEGVGWSVPEIDEVFSSAVLADKIATELSKYHLLYEAAYRSL